MTFSITIAFLIRSSSLIGWIPLAIVSIFSTPQFISNLIAIIQAGIFVALPTMVFSVALDSWYYGQLTVPQYNFLHINVVQNLSNKFGVEVWFYYIYLLKDFLNETDGDTISLLGLSVFTVFQIYGRLNPEISRFPFFLPFIFANLYVLSIVQHKE